MKNFRKNESKITLSEDNTADFNTTKNMSEAEPVELSEKQKKIDQKKENAKEKKVVVLPARNKKEKPELKRCIYCGHIIADSAKVCPNCGGKNKKPIYMRTWFVIMLVLLGFFVFDAVCPAKLDHTCRCKSGHGNRQ